MSIKRQVVASVRLSSSKNVIVPQPPNTLTVSNLSLMTDAVACVFEVIFESMSAIEKSPTRPGSASPIKLDK